jgi:hypothetical protein
MTQKTETRGYLLVASKEPRYYSWACNLLDGIKDYYPEANICLVTEERFLDHRADGADEVIFCDDHYRAKLWALSQTPYDLTFYIDADMEIIGEGIETVFDELGDKDLMFTGLPKDRWYVFMETEFPGGTFTLCGGVCLYRKTEKTMQFMKDWYEYYVKQYARQWWPKNDKGDFDYELYPDKLRVWDQFTLWWLTEKEPKYKDLQIGIFDNDLRWNYWQLLDRVKTPMPEDTVLLHLSFSATKDFSEIPL